MSLPRLGPSGLPTPRSSSSGLPTPRRKSLAPSTPSAPHSSYRGDDVAATRALGEALRSNPPSAFRSPTVELSPSASSSSSAPLGQSQRRPSSSTSSTHSAHSSSSVTAAAPRTPAPRKSLGAGAYTTPLNKPGIGVTPRRSIVGLRPESRQEERPPVPKLPIARAASGDFAIGERVRVESMGMEGTLRFVGEIAGKPGVWAGVELSGGFSGKGKNDGSVGEARYFTCPPQCGIFLQYSKLSRPTTGPSARPPSVASSTRSSLYDSVHDSGRATPSLSGRATPSLSGRVTPSLSGRATPSGGRSTPSRGFNRTGSLSQSVRKVASKPAASEVSAAAEARITAGSRASKYIGMTAKQLSSRGDSANSSPAAASSSMLSKSTTTPRPTRLAGVGGFGQPTPTRAPRLSLGSSTATPMAARSGRTSAAGTHRTPDMPPPPSPNKGLRPAPPRPQSRQSLLSSRPQSRTSIDESSEARPGTPKSAALVSLEANNTALQGKIANLMARSTSHRRTSSLASLSDLPISRPQSEVDPEEALRKSVADEELQTQQQARINQLRARVEALEQENLGLLLERQKSPEPPSTPSATTKTFDPAVEARAVAAERQVQVHTTRLTILESELSASTQAAKNLQGSLDAAQRSMKQAEDERERERMEAKLAQKDFSARLQESEALVAGLREAVETKEKGEDADEAETLARKKEIEVLQNRVGRLSTELEQERTELGAQVDALRKAGQDTIMLYEERLSASETARFDMENHIRNLEERIAASASASQVAPFLPSSPSNQRESKQATALEIDNENLTEQIQHLTGKIAELEEQLEDLQVQAEQDEAAIKVRLDRAKDVEGDLQEEIASAKAKAAASAKTEAEARARISEMEEAINQNRAALESARAEIEGLRAELTTLQNLDDQSDVQTEQNDRLQDAAKQAEADRVRLNAEIAALKGQLEDTRVLSRTDSETAAQAKRELEEREREIDELRTDLKSALDDNDELLHVQEDLQAKISRSVKSQDASESQTQEFAAVREENSALKAKLAAVAVASEKSADTEDQIQSFQNIIDELTRDNAATATQLAAFRTEKDQLLSETEDLKQSVKALELTLEESILTEEAKLADDLKVSEGGASGLPTSASQDVVKLQQALIEAQIALESQQERHESDFERLQGKLIEMDERNQREVQELESLIESKIYREDELEREIEAFKRAARRDQPFSNGHSHSHHRNESSTSGNVSARPASRDNGCELCEDPTHGLEECPLFSGSSNTFNSDFSDRDDAHSAYHRRSVATDEDYMQATGTPKAAAAVAAHHRDEPWCDDCEQYGHATEDCEYAQEVF